MEQTPTLRGITVGDDPAAWAAAGFTVTGDRFVAGGVTVRLAGATGRRGILGWTLDHPAPRDADGLVHLGIGQPGRPAVHPNGVTAVDHVVVRTDDLQRTGLALAGLGITPRREVRGLRGDHETIFRFHVLETCVLEMVAPADPPASPRPARFWGLAFTTADLDAAAALLGEGCGEPHDAVQPGRRIASLRHEALGLSVPTALLSPRR